MEQWPVCSQGYDAVLGWSGKPGFTSAHYNVGMDGYRRTIAPAAGVSAAPPVLAVGDSFTEGEEVDDAETWPSYLQQLLDRRVINAGTMGFGLDQIVLRTEQAATLRPSIVVVSFIAEDVVRTEFSRLWSHPKPYFSLKNDMLDIHNVSMSSRDAGCGSSPFWQQLLRGSLLVEHLMRGLDWPYADVRALPTGAGNALVCPLMLRLSRLELPTLVVAQYARDTWAGNAAELAADHEAARRVLMCATKAGLSTLDLFAPVLAAVKTHGVDELYRKEHHSPEGNRLVAEAIAAVMR